MVLRWKAWNIGLICFGLVVVILSLVWRLVIFPPMAKLPSDHHKIVNFEGTYKVMNPQTNSLDEIPVNVKREQQGTEVQDNVLIINQTITATHAVAGIELTQFGSTEVLGVDRTTREYVSGYGDVDRSGQFCFPEGAKEQSYSLWIPAAGRALEAEFIGKERFEGLWLLKFTVSEHDLDIGVQSGTGLPQVLDIVCNMKVEPVSGTTVSSESDITIRIVPAPGMETPVYVSSLRFTDDTMADLVDTARSARVALLWARVYGFWLAFGLGIILTVVGVLRAIQIRPSEEA